MHIAVGAAHVALDGLRKALFVFFAQAAQASGGSFTPLLLIVLLFIVMYFLMIRPQQKRRREAQQMQNNLGPGDQIVTIGGLHGTVVSADDDVVTLEIAPGTQVRFARPAIAKVVPSATPEPAVADAEPVADEPFESPVDERKKD